MNPPFVLTGDILPDRSTLAAITIDKLLSQFLVFDDKTLILFDLETLGLSPIFEYEQITEISAWAICGKTFEVIDKLNYKIELNSSATTLLDDDNSLERLSWTRRQSKRGKYAIENPNELLKMTHYEELKNIPVETEYRAIEKFIDFVLKFDNVVLVAHNIRFDLNFISTKAATHERLIPTTETLDTLKLSRYFLAPLLQTLPTHDDISELYNALIRRLGNHDHISSKLGELASAMKINAENWHNANADVEMMFKVLQTMLDIFDKHRLTDISGNQQKIINRNIKKKKD
jgi:DNA polymerase III alpha subunit (gram-positive type)